MAWAKEMLTLRPILMKPIEWDFSKQILDDNEAHQSQSVIIGFTNVDLVVLIVKSHSFVHFWISDFRPSKGVLDSVGISLNFWFLGISSIFNDSPLQSQQL